ncbi:hypothetical protein T484DRAFT_3627231, partial [Baffinella frigidus]
TLHPTPYTIYPTPYTLHPTPYTLHPTPYTLQPTPYTSPDTLHPTPYTLHPTPHTLHLKLYTLHPAPYTLHPTPYILHPILYTLHPAPNTLVGHAPLTCLLEAAHEKVLLSLAGPSGPLGFDFSQHSPTARPSVDGICIKSIFAFGSRTAPPPSRSPAPEVRLGPVFWRWHRRAGSLVL